MPVQWYMHRWDKFAAFCHILPPLPGARQISASCRHSVMVPVGCVLHFNCLSTHAPSSRLHLYRAVCQADGKWTDINELTCVPCPMQCTGAGDKCVYNSTTKRAECHCKSGFQRYNGSASACEAINCGAPDPAVNGTTNVTNGYNWKSVVTYKCLAGHIRVSGDFRRECSASETQAFWTGSRLVCKNYGNGDESKPTKKLRLVIIIGSSMAGFLILIVVGLVILKCHKLRMLERKRLQLSNDTSSSKNPLYPI